MISTIRIVAPHFTCGVVVKDKVVIEGAPIVKYMVGWSSEEVRGYCNKKGWKYDKTTDTN